MGLIYSIFAFLILLIFGNKFALLFLETNQVEIIKNVHQFLISNSSCYFPLALVNIIRFMIQGMGYSKLSVFAGVFEMIARGAFGFYLVPKFGFFAATFASPAAWVLADIFLVFAFIYCYRELRIKVESNL